MLWLVAVSLLVLGAQAEDCCSAEDRREIATFWEEIWGGEFTGRRVVIAQQVFARLFAADPESKKLFEKVNVADVNSPEFKAHCVRVINGLDVVINLLADPDTLIVHLSHLNMQHKARAGVTAKHFEEIGKAFAEVLPAAGSCFNAKAWNRCFHRVADVISEGL